MQAVALFVLAGLSCLSLASGSMQVVTQFADGTWLENLAVRSDGQLLITTLTSPHIISLDPSTGVSQTVATFPNVMGTCGIVELSPNVFAVTAGNSTAAGMPVAHSWSLWLFDSANNSTTKIVDIPQAGMLNGLAAINSHVIVAADSSNGAIYRIDTRCQTPASSLVVTTAEALSPTTSFPLGVNGLRFAAPWLYFSNSAQALFGRIAVHKNGTLAQKVEVVANNFDGVLLDDFALSPKGYAYATTNPFNQIVFISSNGSVSPFVGALDSLDVAGCTSAQFSRDLKTLYVTTNGGIVRPINGSIIEGGKLVAISL